MKEDATAFPKAQPVAPPFESGAHGIGAVVAPCQDDTLRRSTFVSYSRRDEKWPLSLQTALTPILRSCDILLWSDARIDPGRKWRDEIQRAIGSSRVAILLVSPNYLASSFIVEHELAPILKAAVTDGLKVLWIPISASLVESTEIAEFRALCSPSRPLDSMTTAARNRVWVDIAQRIHDSIDAR